MALTENGLTIRRFPEVQSDIQEALTTNLNTSLVFDSDTLIGQLTDIIGAEIADKEALIQAIYDSFDLSKAEGAALDRLVALIGIQRLAKAHSLGVQTFKGNDGVSIPAGAIFKNPSTGDEFETLFALSLRTTACEEVVYRVSSLNNLTDYVVTINGNNYTYTSSSSATASEIVNGLVGQINLPSGRTWEASNESGNLKIVTTDFDVLNITATTYLSVESVSASIDAQSTQTGEIRAPALSLTEMVTSIGGIQSTFNELTYSTGRDNETDAELRSRANNSTQLAGSGTVPSNLAAIRNVEGVTAVSLIENLTDTVDADGRPPHSYELVVDGGVDGDIAAVLFKEKPAGIRTHGSISVNVLDETGTVRAVNFSRPQDVIVAVRVTYSVYDEEQVYASLSSDIVDSVVLTGSLLDVNDDLIPKRFYGGIYGSTSGINDLTVEVQVLTASGDTPNPANWTENKLTISAAQVASINAVDVTTVQI